MGRVIVGAALSSSVACWLHGRDVVMGVVLNASCGSWCVCLN